MLPPPRHPPSRSAIARARAAYEAGRRVADAMARVERARAGQAEAAAAALTRFACADCGLRFPLRRAARPDARPLRCLCCGLLHVIADARTREVVRRVMEYTGLRRRIG